MHGSNPKLWEMSIEAALAPHDSTTYAVAEALVEPLLLTEVVAAAAIARAAAH